MITMQNRSTEAGPLLTTDGTLATCGWSTQPLLAYDRAAIRTSPLRIKEWDYYLVHDDEYALAFTISDLGYAALVSASLIGFSDNSYITESTLGVLPLGRLNMPATAEFGLSSYQDKRVSMSFEVANGMRYLRTEFKDFVAGQALVAEIVLDQEPTDRMVIATPWAEDPLAFYYNQKVVGMRAVGTFTLGTLTHHFAEDSSLGLLDWGRGVWTRDNTWYWAVAQGHANGHLIGFNLGYGFGDTSAASENMFFLDGVAHKLDRVDFGIPVRSVSTTIGERFDLMSPWHITDNEGRLDLHFTPQIDRADYIDLKLVVSDQHQVFGTLDGWVVLDNGEKLEIKGLRGSAEAVHNVY